MNANSSRLVSIRVDSWLRYFGARSATQRIPKREQLQPNRPISRRFGNRHFCDFSFNTACCERLLQLKDSAAYNLTVDLDVDAIGTGSECTRAQIVYVLTTINSEV